MRNKHARRVTLGLVYEDDDDCDEDYDDDGAAERRTCGVWKNARDEDDDDNDASGENEE